MSRRVLVIDDDDAVRKSFRLALEDTDHEVKTADSGEEGLDEMRANKYDLVYLDLKMPGLDGMATLHELRGIDPDVPVYIATAFHAEFLDQLRNASEDGLRFEVLEKPIDADQIVSLTQNTLERRPEPSATADDVYEFKLYVVGGSENASRAVKDLETILKSKFERQYRLRIIDILDNPNLAEEDGVFATPTVVRTHPAPVRRIVGSLSEGDRILPILYSDDEAGAAS